MAKSTKKCKEEDCSKRNCPYSHNKIVKSQKGKEEDKCTICQKNKNKWALSLSCDHPICFGCYSSLFAREANQEKNPSPGCPTCKKPMTFPVESASPLKGNVKKQAILIFIKGLSKKHCIPFKNDYKSYSRQCKFKDECLYFHSIDGTSLKKRYFFEKGSNIQDNENDDTLIKRFKDQSRYWELV